MEGFESPFVTIIAGRGCREYKIKIWANYMLGIPTETKEEVMDTVRMINEIRPEHYSPAFYTPHPGSDLYAYCLKEGLSLIRSHDSYRRNPAEAKIKGLDYDFLYLAMKESLGIKLYWRNRFMISLERRLYFFVYQHYRIRRIIKNLLNLLGRSFYKLNV